MVFVASAEHFDWAAHFDTFMQFHEDATCAVKSGPVMLANKCFVPSRHTPDLVTRYSDAEGKQHKFGSARLVVGADGAASVQFFSDRSCTTQLSVVPVAAPTGSNTDCATFSSLTANLVKAVHVIHGKHTDVKTFSHVVFYRNNWGEWSPCTVTCAGPIAGTRTRIRTVLSPSEDGSPCPPINDADGAVRQTEQCRPAVDCPEQRCEGLCTGCSLGVTASNPKFSKRWCGCCAAQDLTAGHYAENPCASGKGGSGCASTIYSFAGCLTDGFCSPNPNNGTQLRCAQYGYCSGLRPTPEPTPQPTPYPVPDATCSVTDWSDWSPCSVSCAKPGQTSGTKTRTRQVLSRPDDLSVKCPPTSDVGGLLQQSETCFPTVDCPEVRCEAACQGCNSDATPGTAKWCRCCRAGDVEGMFDASNPCLGTGCGSGSIFQFSGCVSDGYCSSYCQEYGYCSGAEALKCKLSEWSDWGPCSVTCSSSAEGGVQTRTRYVTQFPNDGSACPRESDGPMRETRRCFPPDCDSVRCEGACVGCSIGQVRGSEGFCRCCAAQDRGREFWAENPCRDGCDDTVFEFDQCLRDGFCTTQLTVGGPVLCQEYGVCSNVLANQPPSPPASSCGLLSGSCRTCNSAAPHCQWCAFGADGIAGFTGVCVDSDSPDTCTGISGAKLVPSLTACAALPLGPTPAPPTPAPTTPAPTVPPPPPQCAKEAIGECPQAVGAGPSLNTVCVWSTGVCAKLLDTYFDLPFSVPANLVAVAWEPIRLALASTMDLDPLRIHLLLYPRSTRGHIRVFDAANDLAAPYFDRLRRSVSAGASDVPDFLTLDEVDVSTPPDTMTSPNRFSAVGVAALAVGAILVFSALFIALGIWCYQSAFEPEPAVDHGTAPAVIPVQRRRQSSMPAQSVAATNRRTAKHGTATELRRPRRAPLKISL